MSAKVSKRERAGIGHHMLSDPGGGSATLVCGVGTRWGPRVRSLHKQGGVSVHPYRAPRTGAAQETREVEGCDMEPNAGEPLSPRPTWTEERGASPQ